MNIKKQILLLGMLVSCSMPALSHTQLPDQKLCYSSYRVQQDLDLTVKFGERINHQKTNIDVAIHIREIKVSEKDRSIIKASAREEVNLRSFIFLVRPEVKAENLLDAELLQRYQHPFVVLTDADSGALIDLKSTVKDQAVVNEYLSYFDLFQYSKSAGEYQYKNGNGDYQARMTGSGLNNAELIRKNSGYMKATTVNDQEADFSQSILEILLGLSPAECFYERSKGSESYETTLSDNAFVKGDAVFQVISDDSKTLPENHFFYALTGQLEHWPSFDSETKIPREEALSKIPGLLSDVTDLINDDERFINALLLEKESWPYLAEYILQHGISDALSKELFWALDKIDTTESANALTILATSQLPPRDTFRAVMALGSTKAPLSEESIVLLKTQWMESASVNSGEINELIYIRMMGAFSQQRDHTAPLQSRELKSFLYSQVDGYSEPVNVAIIDAIGNLGGSIDAEGEEILLQKLSQGTDRIRNSAAAAFSRIPYEPAYSDFFINQINSENNVAVKKSLIEVLGKTDHTDESVKHHLLSLLKTSGNSELENKMLGSLKEIDYVFDSADVEILESKLGQEQNAANQRLLAGLILKHRRGQ